MEANKGFLRSEAERLVGALMAKVAARKVAARAEANVAARAKVDASAGANSDEEVLLPAFHRRPYVGAYHARSWSP